MLPEASDLVTRFKLKQIDDECWAGRFTGAGVADLQEEAVTYFMMLAVSPEGTYTVMLYRDAYHVGLVMMVYPAEGKASFNESNNGRSDGLDGGNIRLAPSAKPTGLTMEPKFSDFGRAMLQMVLGDSMKVE